MSSSTANPRKRPHPTDRLSQSHPNPHKRSKPSHRKADSAHASNNTTTHPQAREAREAPTPTPLNPLKRRIRSLTRLLSSPAGNAKLPATIQQQHERELAALKSELADAEKEHKLKEEREARSKMVGRYHMVRFFERRKAERRVKKLRRAVEGQENGSDGGAEEELHEAEVDLQYTMYYPLDEAYVSLFVEQAEKEKDTTSNGAHVGNESADNAAASAGKDGSSTKKQKPEMWHLVSAAVSKGQAALEDLREGRWSDRYPATYREAKQKTEENKAKASKQVQAPKKKPPQSAAQDAANGDTQARWTERERTSKGHRRAEKQDTSVPPRIAILQQQEAQQEAQQQQQSQQQPGNRRERRAALRKDADRTRYSRQDEDYGFTPRTRKRGEDEEEDDETGVGFFE